LQIIEFSFPVSQAKGRKVQRVFPYFKNWTFQGRILFLRRMLGRERPTRTPSLQGVGRGRWGMFMAKAEAASPPRLPWKMAINNQKVFAKL
jgi:hypothetical protein